MALRGTLTHWKTFGDWVDEALDINTRMWTPPETFYQNFIRWARDRGEAVIDQQVFADMLAANFSVQQFHGRVMIGSGLRSVEQARQRGKVMRRIRL
jgi:hypothetical protein